MTPIANGLLLPEALPLVCTVQHAPVPLSHYRFTSRHEPYGPPRQLCSIFQQSREKQTPVKQLLSTRTLLPHGWREAGSGLRTILLHRAQNQHHAFYLRVYFLYPFIHISHCVNSSCLSALCASWFMRRCCVVVCPCGKAL